MDHNGADGAVETITHGQSYFCLLQSKPREHEYHIPFNSWHVARFGSGTRLLDSNLESQRATLGFAQISDASSVKDWSRLPQ